MHGCNVASQLIFRRVGYCRPHCRVWGSLLWWKEGQATLESQVLWQLPLSAQVSTVDVGSNTHVQPGSWGLRTFFLGDLRHCEMYDLFGSCILMSGCHCFQHTLAEPFIFYLTVDVQDLKPDSRAWLCIPHWYEYYKILLGAPVAQLVERASRVEKLCSSLLSDRWLLVMHVILPHSRHVSCHLSMLSYQ